MSRLPTLMIPHGGGPCFFMEQPMGPPGMWDRMAEHLRGLDASLDERPKAVLVISSHWEEDVATVNAAASPHLYYDYYGFPPATYQLTYPAPGSPDLAARIFALMTTAGLEVATETERGLDHGVFIPFKLIYPDADVPIVQLSLRKGLSAREHLKIGKALEPLRDEGVLIVGSGMTYHNTRDLGSDRAAHEAAAFDDWLVETVTASPEDRERRLSDWAAAPGGRYSHPREEHLLPLMVAAGAAGSDLGRQTYGEKLAGVTAQSGFRFG